MKEIILTKGQMALVDDDDFERLSKYKWWLSSRGYAVREEVKDKKRKHIYMHREILKHLDGMEPDHINGKKLDNRKSNLRNCTRMQNMHNYPTPITNTSGFKGVSWHKDHRKWQAYIYSHGMRKHLGYHNSRKEAALAYDKAARELFGDFARLNFMASEAIYG